MRVRQVLRVSIAVCLLASCAHRVVKFDHQNGTETCQGSVDQKGNGCELRYLSSPGDGSTSLTSFRATMRCGQRTQVCGKQVRCECP